MSDIIDVSYACGGQAGYLAGSGVKTVIRYYSRDTGVPEKRLTRQESKAFAAAGMRLAIVHEAKHGDQIGSFSPSLGEADAAYARQYAANVINQPEGSAIYFGVDLDATVDQIKNCIVPYFQSVASSITAANGLSTYKVGIYGSGASCEAVLSAGLAQFFWLAQSKGWQGYKSFLQSNKWSLLQGMPTSVGEINCDPNQANGDFGDFFLAETTAPLLNGPLTVTARPGLRLRSGPGTNYDVLQVVPLGTQVHPIKSSGDWTMVSLAGDQTADGFLNSHFLSP